MRHYYINRFIANPVIFDISETFENRIEESGSGSGSGSDDGDLSQIIWISGVVGIVLTALLVLATISVISSILTPNNKPGPNVIKLFWSVMYGFSH